MWSAHPMRDADAIIRELRSIEAELIELELRAHGDLVPGTKFTAADHARALLHEVRRIERVARQTQR
jgi:hypothetical protein